MVPPTRDGTVFLRNLPILFDSNTFVYFEGTTERRFEQWLEEHAVQVQLKIAVGTIWPKSDFYHVPIEPSLLEEAAGLVEQHGIAYPAIHVHVHDTQRVLLEWHDAFSDDPMYVHSTLPMERVDTFARAIGVGPVSRHAAT